MSGPLGFTGTTACSADGFGHPAANSLGLYTTGLLRVLLNGSGHVGVATDGFTLGSMFQLGRLFSFTADINSGYVGAGWVGTPAASTYVTTGNYAFRQIYDSAAGYFKWQTAPAGTAGAPVSFYTQASLDASGVFCFNSGFGSPAPAFGCRAWANVNGAGSGDLRRASGGISSITDMGVGYYAVNFTTAMPDANYAVNVTLGTIGNTSLPYVILHANQSGVSVPPATTAFHFVTMLSGAGATDLSQVSISVVR